MKFEIETYKGQLIEYDDEYDKFLCDISVEDKYKSAKRISLKDMRKEIDTFIKLNVDFKPFKALFLDNYGGKSFESKNIIAIRTDGKFVIQEKGNSKSYYDKKAMNRAMMYDAEIVKEQKNLSDIADKANSDYREALKELCTKLKPVDLSKFEHIINPAD